MYQLHQQLLQVKVTGSARGALGDRGWSEGASLVWLESTKLQQGSRDGVLVGQGWGTSLLRIALAAAGSRLFHVLCKLCFLPISRVVSVPGGVRPWDGGWWCFFCSLPNR